MELVSAAGWGRLVRRGLAIAACTTLFAPVFTPAAGAIPRDPRLAAVHSWAFAIGDGTLRGDLRSRYDDFDLVIVDGEDVSTTQVRELHASGALVLGYLDVGSIERGRSWFQQARPYRLDYWGDWGEWYANVAAPEYRSLLAERVAPTMMDKGLDGLFLDNLDMIETHPAQARGMRTLVGRLADEVHGNGKLLFAQNGDHVLGRMLTSLDGWNREDVGSTYDFHDGEYRRTSSADTAAAQQALRRIGARGVLTLATGYTDGSPGQDANVAAQACAAGALPFISDIELTRIAPAARCPIVP